RLVAGQVDRLRVVEGRLIDEDVLRDVDQHRARAAGPGDVERLLDRAGEVLDAGDEVGRGRAGGGQANADAQARAGVAVGRVGAGLLVAHQDVAELRVVGQD